MGSNALSHSTPVLISGDFNDVPSSPVYNLLTKNIGSNENQSFTSPFVGFKSAYTFYDQSGVEPYSTYKKRETEICRTIDFIFFQGLKVLKLLEIPPIETLTVRLPAPNYPSDHLAIMAEFLLP